MAVKKKNAREKLQERRERNESIAAELRRLREETDTSREFICQYLGITKQRYQQWEDGYSQPDLFMFASICRYYNLDTYGVIFDNFGL